MKTNTVNNLALAAAFAGLLGGTAARLNAQPVSTHTASSVNTLLLAGTPAVVRRTCPSTPARERTIAKARAAASQARRQEQLQGQGRLRDRRLQELTH